MRPTAVLRTVTYRCIPWYLLVNLHRPVSQLKKPAVKAEYFDPTHAKVLLHLDAQWFHSQPLRWRKSMVATPQMAPETTTQEIASKSLDTAFCLVSCKSNTMQVQDQQSLY